ncbi:hypothetical protein RhiirA1_473571 [Rhizophagus irregularis]|uniref:Uncharacterized protein n=1 Tax=Rhizophagus irregularis TaxID=588596 RepID=A0A2N0R0B0_9GLOM|nr:hypothetical protein RhiirA1_473571 [Rhizophagus irregularis]
MYSCCLLARLFQGTVAADLIEISKVTFAKTANISFSINFYNLKPYAYLHFSSAQHRCSHPGYDSNACDSFRFANCPSSNNHYFQSRACFQYSCSCSRRCRNARQPPPPFTFGHYTDGFQNLQSKVKDLEDGHPSPHFNSCTFPLPNFGSQSNSQASSVEDHLSTLTASLSEVPKMVKLEIEQQSLYLAARDNASTK